MLDSPLGTKFDLYGGSMKKITVLFLSLLAASSVAQASEQLEYRSFNQVQLKIREVGARYGNDNVLAVFDTDDTLLVLNQMIGSEAWYEWQTGDAQCEQYCTPKMLEPAGENAVGKNIEDLLAKLSGVLSLTHAHPNEPEIPADLKGLQQDGIKTIVLTARGFTNRDATLRQYGENGIEFSRVGLNPNQEGLEYVPSVSPDEMEKFGIHSVRPVNYTHGIINANGQHKGVMLMAWLRETHVQPKAIVFVDNESRQTNRVFSVFKDSGIDITTVRYSHADPDRDVFWSGDKREAIDQWKMFSTLVSGIFSN